MGLRVRWWFVALFSVGLALVSIPSHAQQLLATTRSGAIGSVDLVAGTTELIGSAGFFEGRSPGWTGLSFDAAGNLFVTSNYRSEIDTGCSTFLFVPYCSHLYRVDVTSGSILEEIGNTKVPWISDIDFAPDGTLYGNHWDFVGALVTLDPATAQITLLGRFGGSAVEGPPRSDLQNGGLSVDPATGDIWAVESAYSFTPRIFRVDPADGRAIGPVVRLGLNGVPIDSNDSVGRFGFDGLEILPNGRFIATRGRGSSQVYEINHPIPDPVSGLAEVSLLPVVTIGFNGLESLPPVGQALLLTAAVEDLVDGGELDQGLAQGLTSTLGAALRLLDDGNDNVAIHQLEAFIRQVTALFSAGILSNDEARALIDSANAIINE